MDKAEFTGNIGSLTPLIGENGMPKYNKILWHRIPLFEYRYINPELIYTDKNGIQYELDHHFQTDGGSIPPGLRLIPLAHLDPFNFPRGYLFHDCGYQYGGLYMRYPGEVDFKFRLMTRIQVDRMLSDIILLEGGTKYDRFVIFTGVSIGGLFIWDEKKKPLKQQEERKKNQINVYNREGNIIEINNNIS
jgi:hypothetical protein